MFTVQWERSIISLLIIMLTDVSGSFVGINIGTDVSSLPSESNIVSILQAQSIHHVRLSNADHNLLSALANTGIDVIVGVPNDQLLRIGESRAAAADWVKQNIVTFIPATNITAIAVGSEVLTSIPNAALVLVPAMQFLHSALVAANLGFQVKVSSPHSMGMIPKAFPPSMAAFNSTWNSILKQMLHFLKNTNSLFMLNANAYREYTQADGIFPIKYALFRPLAPNKHIVDPNTGLHYTNMFDAMVDATYYSMQALNFSGIPVLVTETGWPSLGSADEPDATVENALIYNSNLIRHVLSNSGTPNQTNATVSAYIYELFNEDLSPGSISDKNWGLFSPNGTSMYAVNFGQFTALGLNSSAVVGAFCVANASAGSTALLAGLNWACGPGSANCSAIQPGQPCYSSDISFIASYAYNDYYHRAQSSGGSCNFGDTAYITKIDPSKGTCIFVGSVGSNTSSGTLTSIAPGPATLQSAALPSEVPHITLLITMMLLVLV